MARPDRRKRTSAPAAPIRPPSDRGPWYTRFELWIVVAVLLGFGGFVGLSRFGRDDGGSVPVLSFTEVAVYEHDPDAFTQGLVVHDGRLFESTGRQGASSLREVELATGKVLRRLDLTDDLFGEGLCRWQDRWIQLTWTNRVAIEYRDTPDGFEETRRIAWNHEGWGLTHDGRHLIASDGTHRLYFMDPATFEVARTVEVTLDGRRFDELNELEYVDGYVYANVWFQPRIVKIDPRSGKIVAAYDFTSLMRKTGLTSRDQVLNGIAYDPDADLWYVTGKLWPKLYAVRLNTD